MKRTYFKRKPKTERQRWIKENDDLLRKIIHLRDKVCQKTGHIYNLQVAHYWTRKKLRVRWDLDNACLLQKGIHYYWAHVSHQEFKEFWKKRLGEERFEALELKARYVAPVKTFDLICRHQELQKKYNELLGTYKLEAK